MKTIEIDRSHELVAKLCKFNVTLYAQAQVSAYKPTEKKDRVYNNVAIQDITFVFNNRRYIINHCWLQERDYIDAASFSIKDLNKTISFKFKFYAYRNKIDTGQHGIKILKINK